MFIFLKLNDFERNWLRLYVYTERKSIFGITAHQSATLTLNHNLQIMSTRYIDIYNYWELAPKGINTNNMSNIEIFVMLNDISYIVHRSIINDVWHAHGSCFFSIWHGEKISRILCLDIHSWLFHAYAWFTNLTAACTRYTTDM